MTHEQSSRILSLGAQTRDKAKATLERLKRAKAQLDDQLASTRASDALRVVTGRTSIDNAIDTTNRLLDRFDRSFDKARGRVEPSAAGVLDGARPSDHRDAHDQHSAATVHIVRPLRARVRADRPLPSA